MNRIAAVSLLVVCLCSVALAEASATPLITAPVAFKSVQGSFDGAFTLRRFAAQEGNLVAVGTLAGIVRDAAGQPIGSIVKNVTVPAEVSRPSAAQSAVTPQQAAGECEVLDISIRLINIELLGLHIALDLIAIEVTAESGPGQLLGNLICTALGLLDGANVGALANTLNQLVGTLG